MTLSPLTSNGAIIYSGLSELDSKTPIVAIATGLSRKSANKKTGDMIQTWILRADMAPHYAAHGGFDSPICGDCPLAKIVSASGIVSRPRRCYVNTAQAPQAIWHAWNRGAYPVADSLPSLGNGRMVRLGAYGDPLAVPYRIWRKLVSDADGWTGYSHSWRIGKFWRFRNLVMASCETLADHRQATESGWRTFTTSIEPLDSLQIVCPNTTHGVSCEKCGLCNGKKSSADPRKSIVIAPHGGRGIMNAWQQVA